MPYVQLSDEELAVLDGHASAKVQKEVDAAKARLASHAQYADLTKQQAELIADIVEYAKAEQALDFQYRDLRRCRVCERDAGYAKYARTSRYHRKGEPNRDKPLYFRGVDFQRSFISIRGHISLGCCSDCFKELQPRIADALSDVRAEIPKAVTGYAPRYKRHKNRRCKECGWEGHDGQMRKLPAIMHGEYAGGCPNCKAENLLFTTKIEITDGYTLVESRQTPTE